MIRREHIRFDRMEFAGSLGDLGTLLPLAVGMIMINGLNPQGLFLAAGLFYILGGVYYRIPVPVQPMKVIGAYAVATGLSAQQISASGAWMALILLIVGLTGLIDLIGRYTPKSVIRGVQLSTGGLLMAQGIKLMWGTASFQALRSVAEPYLKIQSLGPVPIGILLGVAGIALTLLLLENRRFPAGLIVVAGGMVVGLLAGTREGMGSLKLGLHLPAVLPFGLPSADDFSMALLMLVLPQAPMTIGNAVVAYADLSKEYYQEASDKVTYKNVCFSMAAGNILSFLVGGMPVCHGAGGLAAHYRFGARTAGSNLIIGAIFLFLALFLGTGILAVVYLIPLSILGVLLLYAGSQLGMTIMDLMSRKDFFVVLVMLGITLATNLAVAFIVGIALAYALKSERLSV
ncbi:MAG: putative sulfate/molybdate transporter [Deltaproteobacteria bacterium]|nr:putative sulfate/molybdate transporter [Deltaproteobacteria bacterium]